MSNQAINDLLQHRVNWLADAGPEDDIVISTRLRLARNLCDFPFPPAASAESAAQVAQIVAQAVHNSGALATTEQVLDFQMSELEVLDRQILFERRLVSQEFLKQNHGARLLVSYDESRALMINEEDHLRMQVMRPGLQLEECWEEINRMDDLLAAELDFAASTEFGFLTSCPTNVGTGLRASVMLHLPGMVLAGEIAPALQAISQLGFTVRGIFGEGTENLGNLFQISNQSTLGESEEEIIGRLHNVLVEFIGHEKKARSRLLRDKQLLVLDRVGRAYGILFHSYLLNNKEALNLLSGLRFGVDMGMFGRLNIHTVNELSIFIMPAHLQKLAHRNLSEDERDIFRARLVREHLRRGGANNADQASEGGSNMVTEE